MCVGVAEVLWVRSDSLSCAVLFRMHWLLLRRRLHYFSHETTSGLYDVVTSAEADGRVAGYVLDLRNDPGGVFEEAVAMAALFQVSSRRGLVHWKGSFVAGCAERRQDCW